MKNPHRFLRWTWVPSLVLLLQPFLLSTSLPAPSKGEADILSARKLFEANLEAIRRKDSEAYLACYLHSESLARTGPEGIQLGFEELAKSTGSGWPDFFEGRDLQLVAIQKGLVYGTYRYRVRYADREESGISERLFVKTSAGWRIAVSTAFPALPGTPPAPRALVGATLLDGNGSAPVPDAVVVVRNGKIECAGSRQACPVGAGVEILDLSGLTITPGLVDSHVHFSQTGWADGRPDSLDVRDRFPYVSVEAGLEAHPERFFRSYLCSGVTGVFDVGGYPWTWGLRERAERDSLAPHVAAAGPLLSTLDFWLNLPAARQFIYLGSEADVRTGVQYLAAQKSDAVKVWFIPVAERNFDEMAKLVKLAGEESRKQQLPLIVHALGLREAKASLQAGATLLVHSVTDVPVDEEFLRLARDRGTLYCPTLTVVEGYRRLFEAAETGVEPQVDDPNRCVDPETLSHVALTAKLGAKPGDAAASEKRRERFNTYARIASANLKTVRDAGIPIAMGTDAGNPLTLHGPSVYAEMEAMQAAGMTPMEVLVAATRNAAKACGRLERMGTLEAGKEADLLVVEGDPSQDIKNLRRIRYVMRGGVLRTLDELRPATAASP